MPPAAAGWLPAVGHLSADRVKLSLSVVPAASVTASSFLQDFNKVLNISFSLMLGVYGSVAALGYYYFGSSAHTLVTTDLGRNSPFSGHHFLFPGWTVDKLVALSILLNAYTTYPSLVLVMQVSHCALHLAVIPKPSVS